MHLRYVRTSACLFALAASIATASTAVAQPKGGSAPKGPPPKGAPPPAGTGAAGQPKNAAAGASKEDIAKATALFTQGTKLFQTKKFALALDQFRASYDTVASPNSHLYIARCQVEMGDLKEAFRTFQKVIVEAEQRAATEPKYAPTRDSAKGELDELSNKIGVLTITVKDPDPSARLEVNGLIVPKEEWGGPVAVDPGKVTITLSVPTKDTFTKSVDVQKGQKQSVDIDPSEGKPVVAPPPAVAPEQVSSSRPPYLPIAIAAGVVGVAGFTMFGVGGAMSKSTYSGLKDACGGEHSCPDNSHADEIKKGKTQQTVANVGLVVGAVGVAASATFFILYGTSGSSSAKKSDEAPHATVEPDIGLGYAGLHGTF